MAKTKKVSIIFAVLAVIVVIIAIFAVKEELSLKKEGYYSDDYESSLQVLQDTIQKLRKDIAYYEQEIQKIDLEREVLRKELKRIIEDNEKVDTELANGDWDYNIRFLSEYLSEKDSVGEWHRFDDN